MPDTMEQKYGYYIRLLEPLVNKSKFNKLSDKERLALLECIDEYYTVTYKTSKEINVNDIKDDVEWLYSTIHCKAPEYIYICHSFEDTADKILRHYTKHPAPSTFYFNGYLGLAWDTWILYYDLGIRLKRYANDDFLRYRNFLYKGVYDFTPCEDAVFITRCPRVLFDDRAHMHSTAGPAVQWPDHRGDLYYIHGVRFSRKLFTKVVQRQLSAKEVITLYNNEQRDVAIRLYGYEKLLSDLNAKIIDEKFVRQSAPFHKVVPYRLYEVDLNDDFMDFYNVPAKILCVTDASTDRVHYLRVRPDHNTVEQAVAWTFKMRAKDFRQRLVYET